MPWLFGPMKDVAASDKRRGGGKQPVIRRCPNGETQVEFSTYPAMKLLCAMDMKLEFSIFKFQFPNKFQLPIFNFKTAGA